MKLRHLRTIRVVVSLFLFVPAVFMFIDLTGILPASVVSVVASVQCIPGVVKLFSGVAFSAAGLAVVVLLTLFFGRVYCSTLCPLGTLQDLFSRLNRRKNSRRRFRFRRQNYLLHYGLLVLSAALAIGGSFLLLDILEPFSNFGRTVTTLLRPIAIGFNNFVAGVLSTLHVYALFSVTFHAPAPGVVLLPLMFTVILFFMSYRGGRLFCNLLCPAGALLGIMSRVSVFRIVIDTGACKDCGLCEKVCKADCIDSVNMRVDFSACVGCFNCFDACPTVGLKYQRRGLRKGDAPTTSLNRGRRRILRNVTKAAAAVLVLPGDSLKKVLPVPAGVSRSKVPVTPPGSEGVGRFTSRCTACHLCVSVCPTQVLTPAFLEYGLEGILQPRLDYSASACSYDCVQCGQVCPTGAILPLSPDEKKLVQIGKAKFVKDDCIVITKKTECGACSEHCPTKAVRMVKHEGLFLPELNEELCIGCGSCEHPCPSVPNKAIYVEASSLHGRAKKPEVKGIEPPITTGADFPF